MRRLIFLCLLILAACRDVPNTFEVEVRDPNVTTALLRLCGSETNLSKAVDRFAGVQDISCESAGEIVVSFSDRQPVTCPIGYVTPGAVQKFRFVIEGGKCQPV